MTNLHFTPVLLLIVFFLYTASASADSTPDDCVYTLYVKTDSIFKAGTDSIISVTLGDASNNSVYIPDLEKSGLMGPGHDYYERGNLDIFTVKAPCIGSPLCRINVTSDGTGAHHGWYCDYIEVTSTGAHKDCSQTIFYVDQWLALDAPPYQLTSVLDGCSTMGKKMITSVAPGKHGKKKAFAVFRDQEVSGDAAM